MPQEEVVVESDLNGHIGSEREGFGRVHRGWGVGREDS